MYRRFVTNTPPDTIKRKINYDENPFLSSTILKVIDAARAEDEDEYRHVYLGDPREDDDQVIIKRSWIMAAIDAHKALGVEPSGRRRIGFDIADSGADKCATVEAYGSLAFKVDEWKAGEDELLKSASRVHSQARERGAEIDYDSIGVGAFAGGHFKTLNVENKSRIAYHKFNAGGEVLHKDKRMDPKNPLSQTNGDYYANLKAQAWTEVSRRLRITHNAVTKGERYDPDDIISICSECEHLDRLVDELATPRRDFDNRGKMKVESKKDLAKRDVPSPNLADAFIMAFAPREKNYTLANI